MFFSDYVANPYPQIPKIILLLAHYEAVRIDHTQHDTHLYRTHSEPHHENTQVTIN